MNCWFLALTRKNSGKDFSVEIDGDYELRCIKKTKQNKTKTEKNPKKPTSERSEEVSF